MANTPSANYSPTFMKAGSGSDPVDITTGTVMPAAVDTHDHTNNKGLAVGRLASGTLAGRPGAGNAGAVYFATDTPRFHGDDGTVWHPAQSLISEIAGDNAITSFNFTSIPAGFRHLELVIQVRSAVATVGDTFVMQFNGDSGTNYLYNQLLLSNATVSGSVSIGATACGLGPINAANATANYFSQLRILIANYSATNAFKTYQCWSFQFTSALGTAMQSSTFNGIWGSTGAITRVNLITGTGPIIGGSIASLYGL